jgi:hypothetical protein
MTVTYILPATAPEPVAPAPVPTPTPTPTPYVHAPKAKVKAQPVVKTLVYGGVPPTLDYDPMSQLRAYQGGNGERVLLAGGLPDRVWPDKQPAPAHAQGGSAAEIQSQSAPPPQSIAEIGSQ